MHELAIEKDGEVQLALRRIMEKLRLVTEYKHMGSIQTPSRTVVDVCANRTSATYTVHNRFRKKVLKKQAFDDETKVSMIHSLLYSRLLYNMGTWTTTAGANLRKCGRAI